MWWHGWDREKDFDQIAGSLICGHLIECAAYVTGKPSSLESSKTVINEVQVGISLDSNASWIPVRTLVSPSQNLKQMVHV
jgi:hypothetical protein